MTNETANHPIWWKDFLSGYIAGVVTVMSGQPFDNTKVKMVGTKNSFLYTIKNTIKTQGISSLWAGSSFPIIGFGLCNSIIFSTNENIKHRFKMLNQSDKLKAYQFFIAGGIAGLANTIVITPVEHLRIRMAVDKMNQFEKSAFKCFNHMYSHYGLKGLYRGLTVTAIREFFGFGTYFATYEILKQWGNRTDVPWMMLIGGIGGVCGWFAGFAFDNVKTRLQTDNMDNLAFKTFSDVKKVLILGKLTEGFTAGLIRSFPVSALTFYSFEMAMKLFYGKKK